VPINDVGEAMREMRAGSKHIRTRKQAVAVGLKAQRRSGAGRKHSGAAAAYLKGLGRG
jgi:hypothetical protein